MQQRSEETRNRILNAAIKLFAANGYNATGVADICAEAEVSKGAFYHHFPTKQAIFLTLLNDWLAGIDHNLNTVRTAGKTAAQVLLDMTEQLHTIFETADGRLPMFLEFWTQASRDPQVWQATIQPYHRYEQYFASLIQSGISDGSLKPVDPDIAAKTLVSLAVGLLLQGVLDPGGAPWNEVASQSIYLFLDGLARR